MTMKLALIITVSAVATYVVSFAATTMVLNELFKYS